MGKWLIWGLVGIIGALVGAIAAGFLLCHFGVMVEVSLIEIAGIITAIIFIIAVIIGYIQLRTMARASRAEALTGLSKLWNSAEYRELRVVTQGEDKLAEKLKNWYDAKDWENLARFMTIFNFFEYWGFLVKEVKVASFKDANNMLGGAIIRFYRLYEPFLIEIRKTSDPSVRHLGHYFTILNKKISEIRKGKKITTNQTS